jgi:hypothetical protein
VDSHTRKARDDFEEWLASMFVFLDEFLLEFDETERQRLDYSPESLDVVEAWILRTYASSSAAAEPKESRRVNSAACYVGEVFRKTLNSKWDIELDDPSFVFFGMPIIASDKVSECPLTLITAAADRRTGIYLRTVLFNS